MFVVQKDFPQTYLIGKRGLVEIKPQDCFPGKEKLFGVKAFRIVWRRRRDEGPGNMPAG